MPNLRFIMPHASIALVALLCAACGTGSPITPDTDDRAASGGDSQGDVPAAAMPDPDTGAGESDTPAPTMPDTNSGAGEADSPSATTPATNTDAGDAGTAAPGTSDTDTGSESTAVGPIACKRFDDAEHEAIIERINAARAQARDCGSERYAATTPLSWNTRLEDAARRQSDDMATNNFFSHTGSDGSDLGSRVDATGYQLRFAGENIAAGQRSDQEALAGWLDSPGHCRNLMSPNFREMALACTEDAGTDYTRYWTQVFAATR